MRATAEFPGQNEEKFAESIGLLGLDMLMDIRVRTHALQV
jgi:hypothetical protein